MKLSLRLAFAIALAATHFAHAGDALRAGFFASDVTPEIGVPLAGFGGGDRRLIPWDVTNKYPYATWLKPSQGTLDPIRSKVLVLERGEARLYFVSLDLIGADPHLRADVMAELPDLGLNSTNFIMSATHTHSGPGTLFRNRVWELLAADKFHKKIYRTFVQGVAESIRAAADKLEPAELLYSTFEAQGIQKNRRAKDRPVDRNANLLWVRSAGGAWMGALANLAMHGTSLGMKNHLFSSDVLGNIEHDLEARISKENETAGTPPTSNAVVLFVNGAEGDVTPAKAREEVALDFGDQAIASLASARPVEGTWSVSEAVVKLPAAGLNVRGCLESKSWWSRLLSWLRIYLGAWMPRNAAIWQIRLGDMMLMTWPGEPTSALGFQLKKMAADAGFETSWVLGLTNDHMAYFTTREEYEAGGYEACSTLHGYKGGERLMAAHAKLLAGSHSK